MIKKPFNKETIKKVVCVVLFLLAFVVTVALCFQLQSSAAVSTFAFNPSDCTHSYYDGVCISCGTTCAHFRVTNAICDTCGMFLSQYCKHPNWANGKCLSCGYSCTHSTGFTPSYPPQCKTCGLICTHDGHKQDYISVNATTHVTICSNCGFTTFSGVHDFNETTGSCWFCLYQCEHPSYTNGICDFCFLSCSHVYNSVTHSCTYCSAPCPHDTFHNGKCVWCFGYCDHTETYLERDWNSQSHAIFCEICDTLVGTEPHDFVVSSDSHYITCHSCDYVLSSGVYNQEISFFSGTPNVQTYYNSLGYGSSDVPYQIDGTTVFYSCDGDPNRAGMSFRPSYGIDIKRYIFVKYRIHSDEPVFFAMKIHPYAGSPTVAVGGVNYGTTYGEWITVLIDMQELGLSGHLKNYPNGYISFECTAPFDVSYIASDSSVANLRTALLSSSDFYYYGASRFLSTKTEFLCYDYIGNITYCPHLNIGYNPDVGEHSKVCFDCFYTFYFEPHTFGADGLCIYCYSSCTHNFVDGICTYCNFYCSHSWVDGLCFLCNYSCKHELGFSSIEPHPCRICDVLCTHEVQYRGHCVGCNKYFQAPGVDVQDGFLNLFSSIYDAQAKTFNAMLNYDVWGINIAGTILALGGLIIIAFVLKKVFK